MSSKRTVVLGISGFYHDAAAAILVDGDIVAAAQEERFTRIKHDPGFPNRAIEYCLRTAGIEAGDLTAVAFYEKPLTKFERLLETYLSYAPAGFASFRQAMPVWLKQKLHLARVMDKGLGGGYKGRYIYPEHHESHAASAFFPSPFDEAAILTIDGVGEWATAACGVGRGNHIELTHELRFPHSLGLLYSAFTYYTGFKVNSGEYKLMGLAPYGQPKYADVIFDKLIDLKDDGSFRMDLSYFNYCQGLTMTGEKFHQLFGGPPREAESPVTDKDMDLAASIQVVTEEIVFRMARHLHEQTGMKNLCLAGGVALNCVANGRLLREGPFDDLWIQPAAGDAGGALGAAMFVWHQLMEHPRTVKATDSMKGALLGPSFSDAEIKETLDRVGACYHYYDDETMLDKVSELLGSEKVVGCLQGRMEFGPRALGSRSILGDARSSKMQSVMNLKIKFRESFRPFAPSVLREHAAEYFEMEPDGESPYMLLVSDVRPEKRVNSGETKHLKGMDLLKTTRSVVPAITHVDYSARVQTVDRDRHPRYHQIIDRFRQVSGCPVIINTSFNVRGEPIVCSPQDALNCFLNTGMDALMLEHFLLLKPEQPEGLLSNQEEYLKAFKLD